MSNFNKKKHSNSMKTLDSIFRNMSETVTEVSKWRCPYKNVASKCTAKFGCRNQNIDVPKNELYICTGSDTLNYKSAWEV